MFCIFVDTVYVFRSSEIFRHKHGSEYKSTAHFVLKRVHGFRVEHGGVFVNRKDIGVDDERRRVVKDWLLIFISSALFDAPITKLQVFGYGISFVAVCYYNYSKYKDREKAMSMPKIDAKSEDGGNNSSRTDTRDECQSLNNFDI